MKQLLWRAGVGLLLLAAAVLTSRSVLLRWQAQVAVTPVVVARVDLPAFGALTAGQVELRQLPAGLVPGDALRTLAGVVGQYTTAAIPAGRLLHVRDVSAPELLRYGAPADAPIVGLTVPAAGLPAVPLHPGTRVDVWQGAQRVLPDLLVAGAPAALADGAWQVGLICDQAQAPVLRALAGAAEVALTLAPLVRWTPTATATAPSPPPAPAATATPAPSATVRPTVTPAPAFTVTPVTPTPGAAFVKPGPAAGLAVRAGPGTQHPVLTTLTGGAQLTPIGRTADRTWLQVCCVKVAGQDRPGWVRADLVRLTVDVATLPVANP